MPDTSQRPSASVLKESRVHKDSKKQVSEALSSWREQQGVDSIYMLIQIDDNMTSEDERLFAQDIFPTLLGKRFVSASEMLARLDRIADGPRGEQPPIPRRCISDGIAGETKLAGKSISKRADCPNHTSTRTKNLPCLRLKYYPGVQPISLRDTSSGKAIEQKPFFQPAQQVINGYRYRFTKNED